ncbi:hypothetical protein MBLNU459_g4892t1 [Dothideomycetes sp. NU459]
MDADMENWDEDVDFQGDLFTHSVSTVQTNFSSRLSLRSESNAGDEDWHVLLSPDDDKSTNNALQSVKQAGIPIPQNVPASALLGGTIKRLGKINARPKIADDDWGDDLEMPEGAGQLALRPKPDPPRSVAGEERDDFDDFTDGSLGIRFAGTRRDTRNRSSSASAMSPSLGSVTAESEDDDLRGLELPEGPVDLGALLRKRQATELAAPPDPIPEMKLEQPTAKTNAKPAVLLTEGDGDDDFLDDLDIGKGEIFDPSKLTLNRNIKHKSAKPTLPAPTRTPMTTLTFSDKPAATRIPRPVPAGGKPSRLEPVFESGASHITRQRLQPTTTGSQLLRSKRSMPLLRNTYQSVAKPPVPFLPAGVSTSQSHHVASKPPSHAAAYHLRRDSDPHRSQSPPPRSYSRLSSAFVPDTPSRTSRRADLAPAALAREAAAKKTVTKPSRKRNFGDGTELDLFDDLPTSVSKESKFLKQPSSRLAPKSLRNIPSRLDVQGPTKLPIPDRMQTPGPMTPRSPMKIFQEASNTPRYLRDTAASRNAREQRLRHAPSLPNAANPRPRSEGPLMPVSTNWKAQIAARSPHTSPSAQRNKGKRVAPNFIAPNVAHIGKTMTEKGMVFNPQTLRWEGNENVLAPFEIPPPPLQTPTPTSHSNHHHTQSQPPPASPPRPALITPLASDYSNQNIKVVGGMVFDPRRMCWLKLRPGDAGHNNPKSPSVAEDEEDPFAAIEDLKEGPTGAASTNGTRPSTSGGLANDEWLVGEEFDLGPEFIRRQRDEEVAWRRKCEAWFPRGAERHSGNAWRWAIRDIAGQMC